MKFHFHKWKYLPWPDILPCYFFLGAPYAGRVCLKCNKMQYPKKDQFWKISKPWNWRWKTIHYKEVKKS